MDWRRQAAYVLSAAHADAAPEADTPLDESLLDAEDAYLLSDEVAQHPADVDVHARPGLAKAQVQAASVTWLRRTEYLGAEQRRHRAADARAQATPVMDTSRESQIARIESGFAAANTPIASLQHPTKKGVHAVDAYELLPDPETWASNFQLVRFAGVLGRSTNGEAEADPRLDAALLRPVTDPLTGQQRVSMYLTCADELPQYAAGEADGAPPAEYDEAVRRRREDVAALRYKKRRRTGTFPQVPWLDGENSAAGDANEYATGFRHVRELEPFDEQTETSHLLTLTFDDASPDAAPELDGVKVHGTVSEQTADTGDDDLFDDEEMPDAEDITTTLPPQSAEERRRQHAVLPASQNRKVAYYHRVDMRYGLRIRRQRKAEQRLLVPYEGFWHRIVVGHRPSTERETTKRLLLREAVDNVDVEGLEYEESEEEAEAEPEPKSDAPDEAAAPEDTENAPEDAKHALDAQDSLAADEDAPADPETVAERAEAEPAVEAGVLESSAPESDHEPDAERKEESAREDAEASNLDSDSDADEDAELDPDELAALQADQEADGPLPTGRRRHA